MSSFSAPFYGEIISLAVDSLDNSLWLLSRSAEGGAISPCRIDVKTLLETKNPFLSVTSHALPEQAQEALGHHTGLYVATESRIYRMSAASDPEVCFSVDKDFGLQGIIEFRDGRAHYSPKSPKKPKAEGVSIDNLLLVGSKKALVVAVQEGSFTVIKELNEITLDHSSPENHDDLYITAWAAEVVVDQESGEKTYHCAFGLNNGGLSHYYTATDHMEFKESKVIDANTDEEYVKKASIGENETKTLHKRAVNALVYVREIDRYQNEVRYLVTTGSDQKNYQINLMEGIAIPRNPKRLGHTKQIRSFIPGLFSDGDGKEQSPQFGRFYSIGDDQRIKSWVNKYDRDSPSGAETGTPIQAGTIMTLPLKAISGTYSKGDWAIQDVRTPFLVVGGRSELLFFEITNTNRTDVEDIAILSKNGRIQKKSRYQIKGGRTYVREFGVKQPQDIREKSIQIFGEWSVQWLLNELYSISNNQDLDSGYREKAIALIGKADHPRRIVLLEELISSSNETIQKKSYDILKDLFSDSLRAQDLALKHGSSNTRRRVIRELAAIARGNDNRHKQALQNMRDAINDDDLAVAKEAFFQFAGEKERLSDNTLKERVPVISGVEGVLIGIFSKHTVVRSEMARILRERNLLRAFETTLILRRMLEDKNKDIRARAIDVSLLRVPKLATIIRKSDEFLHKRLCALEYTDNAARQEAENNPPSDVRVRELQTLFRQEDPSIREDLDVLVEFSSCSKDDVSIYALSAKAALGYQGALQGLLQLTNSRDEVIMRQTAVALGCFLSDDDAFQALGGLALSGEAPDYIRLVAMKLAIRGYDQRGQDPVQKIIKKLLNSGSAEIRRNCVTITQVRIKKRMARIELMDEKSESGANLKTKHQELATQLKEAKEALEFGKQRGNELMIESGLQKIEAIEAEMENLPREERSLESEMTNLYRERDLLRVALHEETIDFSIRKEVYKIFYQYNLEDIGKESDKTPTLRKLLDLRDEKLFKESLSDLGAHIALDADRNWAISLFEHLINQDFKPKHHSNVLDIWKMIANQAQKQTYEPHILRVGLNCKIPCRCRAWSVCTRHQIRRDAFRRVLAATGDWLGPFIRDALFDTDDTRSRSGRISHVAVGSNSIKAVGRMKDPEAFIFSLLTEEKIKGSDQKIGYVCNVIKAYPRYYSARIRKNIYELRTLRPVQSLLLSNIRFIDADVYAHFFQKIETTKDRHLVTGALMSYATTNGKRQAFYEMLYATGNYSLQQKALNAAQSIQENWAQEILEKALYEKNTVDRAFRILYARADRASLTDDSTVRIFLKSFLEKADDAQKYRVLEKLKLREDTPKWVEEMISSMLKSDVESLRERAYRHIANAEKKQPWVVSLLKEGLMHPNAEVADICFNALYAVNKLLGKDKERQFLTETMKKAEKSRRRAIATALQTTASWRAKFIVEALNDEDAHIRNLVCEQIQSIPGMSDSFYQNLLNHQHENVRQMAMDVLCSRGLFRPKQEIANVSLEKTMLENPPPMPNPYRYKHDIWSRWSARWMEWIWAVRAWKDRKLSAVISAGKTHNPEYYDTFKSLLSKLGYHTSPSKLWSDAINYTSWSKEDWCNFVILKTGWVLSPLSEPYAIKEADRQKNARYRVAWHVALIRFGRYNSLIWLHDQYYDVVTEREKRRRSYYNRNPYKKHIKLSYIYEGMFAVESFVAIGNKPEGEGFPLLQRMMEERQDQCLDIFRLNMLRLSYFGGPVDFIGIGYTCSEQQVNLESVAMREHSHDKDALLSALIPMLNGFDHYAHDPYELANVGGNWYNVVRLLFEVNSKSYSVDESSPRETWQQLAMLLSVSDSKLRARGVDLYFRRHRLGERKGRFQADIDNFYRQLSDKSIPCLPLSQNREEVSKKQAHDLAFDAYIGLIRKTDFDINYRREALRYLVSMCNADLDPSRSLATLHVAFSMGAEQLRWDAYGYLITQQASHLREKISFEHLVQMGLRSPDKRLKKAAVSLIWVTDQLTHEQKISRLESIVRNSIDVAAEYAFRLLYAFAGRPKAWDEADAALKEGNEAAKNTLADKQAELDAQIEEANRHFKEFEEIPGNKSQRQNAINQRRAERDQTVRQLELQKDEAQKAYEKAIAEADDAHKAKMAVKLSDADQEVLGARFARRDALLSMAIGAYAEKLTKIGVDLALRELCRRRPYAEQEKEEYPGYYIQLLRVLEEGLTCSYSNTVRHTAMSMAKNLFVTAYPVLLRYLNSHDRQDQKDGLRGLVMLGQNALTSFKDEEGNAFERTSVIFLDRLADDRFGNIDRRAYFDAIAQLRDRHPSVVETLFEFLDRGTQDPDYTSALRALISISRCTEPVLTNVAWRDLSKNHFSVLQKHLVRELDWDQVSIEQFIEFYDMVYDEILFARIIDNLYMRSDYASILKFRLIHWAKYTKGFDIKKHLREEEGKILVRKSPIDEILQTFASLRKAPNMQDLAIRALVYRLDHRDLWVPDARDQAIEGQSVLLEALTESLGTLETEVTELQLLVAECLARAGKQSLSANVFSYLMKVAVGVNYSIEWRIRAMRTLGHLADERAVVTLLMAAGFDAFGEKIPMEDNVSISAYNQERLAVVAAEALGGIIFAQEAEGIFQLISSMTRSRNSNTKEKGYRALRYFSRSDAHALEVARLLAQRLQVALNRNNASETRFYSNLFFELLEPIPDENKHRQDSRTNALIISETKETLLKEYMLATLFGDVFNLEGDPFYPLSVEKTLWEISNNSLLEKTYREVRQLIHGEFAKREFIDLAYLKDKSEEERIERLRPEILLFKNKRKIAYTEEAVDALADYLSVDQLFALVAYAEEEEYHSGNLRERYRTIQHALVYRESPPIKEALSRFKQDYLVDVENFEDASLLYTNTAMAIFNEHRDRLETYKSDFFSVMSDFFRTIGALVGRLKQGEKGIAKVITHYMAPLQSLLERTIQLGWSDEEKTGLSEMIAALLSWKDDINVDVTLLLKQYFFVGNIDWNLIESLLEQSSRENRLLFVHLLTPTLAKDCTPKILGWLLEDNAALIRLADVLRTEEDSLLDIVGGRLLTAGQPTGTLLLLARLKSLSLYKSTIAQHRDKENRISDEKGMRPESYRATQEDYPLLSVESLMRGVALIGTQEAEDYLTELSKDETLDYQLRRMARSCASRAYRKRVPLHLRRVERS